MRQAHSTARVAVERLHTTGIARLDACAAHAVIRVHDAVGGAPLMKEIRPSLCPQTFQ